MSEMALLGEKGKHEMVECGVHDTMSVQKTHREKGKKKQGGGR